MMNPSMYGTVATWEDNIDTGEERLNIRDDDKDGRWRFFFENVSFRVKVNMIALGTLLMLVLVVLGGHDTESVVQQGAFLEFSTITAGDDRIVNVDLDIVASKIVFKLKNKRLSFVARTFDGLFPSKSVRVRRGDTLHLHVRNKLGKEGPWTRSHSDWNSIRLPNTTSIHTHGLHVSPVTDDNIFIELAPGAAHTFVYDIPTNHPQGTFFVHPHFHGSEAVQMAYGMVFALVVEGEKQEASIAGDFPMVVGLVDVGSGKTTDVVRLSSLSHSELTLGLHGGDAVDKFIVLNGIPNPQVKMIGGEWYRWRLINSAIDGVLAVRNTHGDCSAWEIAADGVNHGKPRQVFLKGGAVVIPPGSRRDLLVSCLTDGARFSSGPAGSASSKYDEKLAKYLGPNTKILNGDLLTVKLLETGAARRPVPLVNEESGYTPEHLGDLRLVGNVCLKQDVNYTQGGPTTKKIARNGGDLYSYLGINNRLYSNRSDFVVERNCVVEWTVRNEKCMDGSPALESHPFHLHTNHFQVVEFFVGNEKNSFEADFRVGDWRDTIAPPAPGNVTIRWVARDFAGRTVLHCHTLAHETAGMMANIDIT